jgi:hypothetical protein
MIRYALCCVGLALAATAAVALAADPCATFFWTAAHHEPVARYQPRYLVGEGLEDVGMDQIVGRRIRRQWAQQAASCFAEAQPSGYFAHPDFTQTGVRLKTLSERLTDVRDVIQQLGVPNSDPIYQDSLDRARTSTYAVVDTMANATHATVRFLDGLARTYYDQMLSQLALVLDLARPASLRTTILDQLCAPANVAQLAALDAQCFDAGTYCELTFLFVTINHCTDYQDGQTLDQLLGRLTDTQAGLVQEHATITAEHTAIVQLWDAIQSLRE